MNAKLSQQSLWHGLKKTIQTLPHTLWVSLMSESFLYILGQTLIRSKGKLAWKSQSAQPTKNSVLQSSYEDAYTKYELFTDMMM